MRISTALPAAARLDQDLRYLTTQLGVDAVQFFDHNFFDREQDTAPLLEVLAKHQLPWWCFARSDALLNLFGVVTMLIFWNSYRDGGRGWLVPCGVASGLAVLTKGPVGLVLPSGVLLLFLLWSGKLALLRDRRLLWATLAFTLVIAPWYAWVGADTKADFLRGFLGKHNVSRLPILILRSRTLFSSAARG